MSIYADYAASVPPYPEALTAFEDTSLSHWENPSSLHNRGLEACACLDRARKTLGALLGCDPSQLFFTSGGSESIALALQGYARRQGKPFHLVVGATEHKAVHDTAEYLRRNGCTVTYVQPDADGVITPEGVEAALRPDTRLVAVMSANNEVGTLLPIGEIGDLLHRRRIPFFSDGIQLPDTLSPAPFTAGCDMMSFSGRKCGAVPGIGLLYLRSPRDLAPLHFGGGQEHGLRSGTQNVAGAVSLAVAMEQSARHWGDAPVTASLRDRFEAELCARVQGITLHGSRAPRLAGLSNIEVDGLTGQELVSLLNLRGVAASASSACDSHSPFPSRTLTSMGLSSASVKSSLRFSFSHRNAPEEALACAALVADCIAALRRLHP